MSGILAQLGGNPFNTIVGQKIEQATDVTLPTENWALNLEICDIINETDEGAKDAIKAIRKRLQQNAGKNYTVVMYTLTVLETAVKNCGKRFHNLVSQKDFILDLIKLIGPKNDPPTFVQEKVLGLIQSWADAFRSNPEMQGVVQVYNDLKQKGIEFPMTDLDSLAPIHTPQRSVPEQPATPVKIEQPESNPYEIPQGPLPNSGPINLNPDQLAKLRSELDVVQANMKVFGEMLTELVPGQEHPSDLELLQDLQKTCQTMQNRIVELIDKVANEQVTSELLRINDELNNLFLRFERFDKKRTNVNHSFLQSPPKPAQQVQTPPESKPLIDFGDDPEETTTDEISTKLAGMNIAATATLSQIRTVSATNKLPPQVDEPDEFDMFAQSRSATYEKSKTNSSTYANNSNPDQMAVGLSTLVNERGQNIEHQMNDYDEMSRWLQDKPIKDNNLTLSSSEFDQFLEEQAAESDKLPSVTGGNSPREANAAVGSRRQMDKEDASSALFAL